MLYTISLTTNIVISMREHGRGQWENITDGYVHFVLSFVDLSYVNEVWQQIPITSDKRPDLYKVTVVKLYCVYNLCLTSIDE